MLMHACLGIGIYKVRKINNNLLDWLPSKRSSLFGKELWDIE
jgi:hypothetical protein